MDFLFARFEHWNWFPSSYIAPFCCELQWLPHCSWWKFLADGRNCFLESVFTTILSLKLEDIRVAHLLFLYATEPETGPRNGIREIRLLNLLSFFCLLTFFYLPNKQVFDYQKVENLLPLTTTEIVCQTFFFCVFKQHCLSTLNTLFWMTVLFYKNFRFTKNYEVVQRVPIYTTTLHSVSTFINILLV